MTINRSFCVAPMMKRTDRHFRYLLSLISKNAILFTEMIHINAINHSFDEKILKNEKVVNPTVLQIGGSSPSDIAKAVEKSNAYNYCEVNLNVGCPSSKVQSGNFGAVLMKNKVLVKECISAIKNSTDKYVSIKIRLGVDDFDIENDLNNFVEAMIESKVDMFYVHARIALLKGLNPKLNRSVPPLNYQRVKKLKEDYPEQKIVINGGISSFVDAKKTFSTLDGIMVGREIYNNPMKVSSVDSLFFKKENDFQGIENVVIEMFKYLESLTEKKDLHQTLIHMQTLFKDFAGARRARELLSTERNLKILEEEILKILKENTHLAA